MLEGVMIVGFECWIASWLAEAVRLVEAEADLAVVEGGIDFS